MGKVVKLKDAARKVMRQVAPRLSVQEKPNLGDVLGSRGVWVLATLSKDKQTLVGEYYAICVRMGTEPVWAVFSVTGTYVRAVYGARPAVERAFKNHVWRRVPARWKFMELAWEKTSEQRTKKLLEAVEHVR